MASSIVVASESGNQQNSPALPVHIGEARPQIGGVWSGRTIRAHIEEIQTARVGRRFARKDRRPLDPPPVVQLRLFESKSEGDNQNVEEELRNLEDIYLQGFLCHVDLFNVPSPSGQTSKRGKQDHNSPTTVSQTEQINENTEQVLNHTSDGFPILTNNKCTEYLSGSTVVQAVGIGWEGDKRPMFVFGDLSVKHVGHFVLRYRCFDVLSRLPEMEYVPALAECFGGRFQVFSTKRFPGLPPPTALTQHVARWGIKVKVREGSRKRLKETEMSSDSEEDSDGE